MGLKEQRAKAKAAKKATTKRVPPKPADPKPVVDTGSAALANVVAQSTQATTEVLQAALFQQAELIQALQTAVTEQGRQLKALLSRPVEVEAGSVEVNMPPRASGFAIEYGADGRPARLVPNYETKH